MGSLKLYPGLGSSNYINDQELVRNASFCRELTPEALENIQQAGKIEYYRRGDAVFRQRDEATHIYLLLQGKVSITTARSSGECTIVEMVPAGKVLLLNSCMLNLPYMVSAEALTDLRVLAIPAPTFIEMLTRHPSLSMVALRQMAYESRLLVDQVRQLKLQTANERLAHYILSRLDRHEGSVITELEDERRVIAQRLGMTPESLSRSIAALKNVGVVFEQRTVRVADAASLRNYCGLELMD